MVHYGFIIGLALGVILLYVNVVIQSGITYEYCKALAILCKLVMPVKQLFNSTQCSATILYHIIVKDLPF